MSNYTILNCDLLDSNADYIAHQCNATGNRSAGLAAALFKKWPKANIYSGKYKQENRTLGEIISRKVDNTTILNMIIQKDTGKPKPGDSMRQRLEYFETCLSKIIEIHSTPFTIAFPYGIGCGLAGGIWSEYEKILKQFASNHPSVSVIICKL